MIYEINTPVPLREVSGRAEHSVTLKDMPDAEWDQVARLGTDTVWFMGIWKRSRITREMAKGEVWLRVALPDASDEDIIGSAYSIQEYISGSRMKLGAWQHVVIEQRKTY